MGNARILVGFHPEISVLQLSSFPHKIYTYLEAFRNFQCPGNTEVYWFTKNKTKHKKASKSIPQFTHDSASSKHVLLWHWHSGPLLVVSVFWWISEHEKCVSILYFRFFLRIEQFFTLEFHQLLSLGSALFP